MRAEALSGVGGAVVADTFAGTVAFRDRGFHLLKADSPLAAFRKPGTGMHISRPVNFACDRLWCMGWTTDRRVGCNAVSICPCPLPWLRTRPRSTSRGWEWQ